MIVVTNDLLKLGGEVTALFNTELRNGVAKATDQAFVSTLIAATTPIASTGAFLSDLGMLLALIDGSAEQCRCFEATLPFMRRAPLKSRCPRAP